MSKVCFKKIGGNDVYYLYALDDKGWRHAIVQDTYGMNSEKFVDDQGNAYWIDSICEVGFYENQLSTLSVFDEDGNKAQINVSDADEIQKIKQYVYKHLCHCSK